MSFVVPRYGQLVLGGAETQARLTAEDLAAHGVDVEVLTTCAIDHFTWRDHHPAGATVENGVRVHRFPVNPHRDQARFGRLHAEIGLGHPVPYASQIEWMAESVWSDDLQRALERRSDRWLVGIPYLFGTTFWTAAAHPDRTVLIPCAHDEPHVWQPIVRAALRSAAGCIANSPGEAELLGRLVPGMDPPIGGVGYRAQRIPSHEEVASFCRRHGTEPGYLLYAGRREVPKGVPLLFENYAAYRRARPDAPPLGLMGKGELPVPDEIADHVVELGFLDAEEVPVAFAAASVFVHPSTLESFGMVLLESWLLGTPALVNGRSPILVGHCRASGAGLWFDDADEFREALDVLLDDPGLRDRMASQGAEYVLSTYSWEGVRTRFLAALDGWS
ncbi:MAG: glycosyltransferase family 4 protein [Thermoleophilia bacterium]